MKIFLVVLAIFVAAAWANEEEEQDKTEVLEAEDPSVYYPPKHCGTRQVCTHKQRCRTRLVPKTVCRNHCSTVKKCTKHQSYSYDSYGSYYPPKVYCVPVTSCRRRCRTQRATTRVCRLVKSCRRVPKICQQGGWKHYGSYY